MMKFIKTNGMKLLKISFGMILGITLFLTHFGSDSKVYAEELNSNLSSAMDFEGYLNARVKHLDLAILKGACYSFPSEIGGFLSGYDTEVLEVIFSNPDCFTLSDVEGDPEYIEIEKGEDGTIDWKLLKGNEDGFAYLYLTATVNCSHINYNGSEKIWGGVIKYPFRVRVIERINEVAEAAPCNHSYEWEVTKQATATQDGEVVNRCKYCGEIQSNTRTAVSGYAIFTEETIKAIQNASEKEVVIETNLWESFPVKVLKELSDKKDVSLTIRYKHQGNYYTLTIPAGSDLSPIINDNLFVGFRYLDSIFGGSQIVK